VRLAHTSYAIRDRPQSQRRCDLVDGQADAGNGSQSDMNEHGAVIADDEKHARADIGDTDAQPFGSAAPNLDSEIKVRSRHV